MASAPAGQFFKAKEAALVWGCSPEVALGRLVIFAAQGIVERRMMTLRSEGWWWQFPEEAVAKPQAFVMPEPPPTVAPVDGRRHRRMEEVAARRAQARALSAQGYRVAEIARHLDVDRATVWNYLKRDGWEHRSGLVAPGACPVCGGAMPKLRES